MIGYADDPARSTQSADTQAIPLPSRVMSLIGKLMLAALGLVAGSIVGFITGVYTGLFPFNIC